MNVNHSKLAKANWTQRIVIRQGKKIVRYQFVKETALPRGSKNHKVMPPAIPLVMVARETSEAR